MVASSTAAVTTRSHPWPAQRDATRHAPHQATAAVAAKRAAWSTPQTVSAQRAGSLPGVVGPFRRIAGLGCAFSLVGLAMVQPAIGHPWFWDDLHWFRRYSLDEVLGTFVGNSDPSGIEQAGFRPLHLLSNMLRYELFGESPDANRYASVLFLGLGLALLVATLRELRVPVAVGAGAALLALTAKNMTYTYAWASEGYQAIQMAAFGAATLTAAIAVRDRRRGLLLASFAFWAVTLFIKDQGIFLLPALALVCVAAAGLRASSVREAVTAAFADRAALVYVGAAGVLAVLVALARIVLVPEATPPGISVYGLIRAIGQGAAFSGEDEAAPARLAIALLAVTAAAVPMLARARPLAAPRNAAFGALAAALASCVYGLQYTRSDLVYFPLFFFGVFACSVVWLLLASGLRPARAGAAVVVAVLAVSAGFGVRGSFGVQEAMAPWSVQTQAYDYEFIYGAYRDAVMPAERRAKVKASLARAGITGYLGEDDVLPILACRALDNPWPQSRLPRIFAFEERPVSEMCARR
jgi:hypothetical protein